MIRAFTGPSKLDANMRSWAASRMLSYPDADVWASGCAYGIDTLAAQIAVALSKQVALFVPDAYHNEQLVERFIEDQSILKSIIPCGSYRDRNTQMVEAADHLVAFVKRPTFYRSGEWMTINIARHAGINTSIEVIPGGGV